MPAAHVNIDAGAAAVLNRAIVSYREVFATAAPVGIYNRHIGVGHAIHRSARDRVRFTAVIPSIDFRKRIVNNNRTNNNNKKKKSSRNIIRHRPILLVVIKNIITRVCVCVWFSFRFLHFFFHSKYRGQRRSWDFVESGFLISAAAVVDGNYYCYYFNEIAIHTLQLATT